jgi:hypothetical protein
MQAEGYKSADNNIDFAAVTPAQFATLKELSIDAGPRIPATRAKESFVDHIEMLRKDLTGASQLVLYHAWLVVAIRRRMDLSSTQVQFLELWSMETNFLITSLNSRWLVSACDTLADVSPDPVERATALSASLLVNTVKLYETERWLSPSTNLDLQASCQSQKTGYLFDGITSFAVGRGDMIKNLLQRILRESANSIAGQILQELIRRLHSSDTVFRRLMNVHSNERTSWESCLKATQSVSK